MSTTVTYKGNTLTTVDNTIKTLKTAGKYMEGDIILTDVNAGGTMVIRDSEDSHGGIVREITAGNVVTGTKSITENGTYDVAEYADVDVDVSSGGGGFALGTFTVEGSVSSSFIYILGFIDCIVHNGQPTIVPRDVRATASGSTRSLNSTGHWFIAEDGFMYVAFIGNSVKAVPVVTATSGTATYVAEFDQNEYMYSGYSYKTAVQGYGRIYKLSQNAVVTLTYVDHS